MRARIVAQGEAPDTGCVPSTVDSVSVPSLRESMEAASLPALRWLSGLPRAVPFLAVLGLMVAGIVIDGWGWIFIAVVVLFLAWMLYLGWPRLTGAEKFMRVAILIFAGAVTVTRALPHG